MYLRALDGYEKALGRDHKSILSTVNNLGALYKDQGRLTEAELMLQRAIGRDHASALETVNNLGSLYKQGRWGEAERLEMQVMETNKTILGVRLVQWENTPTTLDIASTVQMSTVDTTFHGSDVCAGHCLQGRQS
jgi:tetratricopeptide (TPR) repeat protein